VTVTCDKDKAFRRRFAGHVENGKPGLSDPAILTHSGLGEHTIR
jgi:phospholipase C